MVVCVQTWVRKVIDGSGKRIGEVRILIGRAVNVCNYLRDALLSLARSVCELFIGCNAVSWLSVCYIEDDFTFLFWPVAWPYRFASDTVSWCLSYIHRMNLPSLTSSTRYTSP